MDSNVDMTKREKMMDKISAMFKLAENNPSQKEAELALSMARKLLIQYQIDEMELKEKGSSKQQFDSMEAGCVEIRPPQSRLHKWITTMCSAVCVFFDVKYYFYKGNTFNKIPPRFIFYGVKTNCEIAAFAFNSIYQQITHLGKKYKVSKEDFSMQGYYSDFSIFSVQAKMEYREGLASGLHKRANEEKNEESDNSKVTALAIRSQDIADEWIKSKRLNLVSVKKDSHRYGTNTNSWRDGVRDASKIDVHGRGLNSRSSSR